MSFIRDFFIFLYEGMDALDIEKWKLDKVRFPLSSFKVIKFIDFIVYLRDLVDLKHTPQLFLLVIELTHFEYQRTWSLIFHGER